MPDDAPTVVLGPPGDSQRRPPIPAVSSTRERCASCGAALASDQRYCVECGQRRGGTSTPSFGQSPAATVPADPVDASHAKRPLLSVNATLIAGVGTLLLAMGIGILIGRSGQGSSTKAPAVQLVTAPAAAGAASGSPSVGGSETPLPGASTTTTGATGSKSAGSTATPKPAPKKSRPSAPKAVKLGSKGSGRGYQKGKFTGNFFGEGEK